MKRAHELTITEALDFIQDIQDLAFRDYDGDSVQIYNPDKELDSDTLSQLVYLLHHFDLAPKGEIIQDA